MRREGRGKKKKDNEGRKRGEEDRLRTAVWELRAGRDEGKM